MTRTAFSGRLQILRRSMGLTQLDLSFAVGVPQSVISAWETGKKEPCGQDIAALARELNVTQETLMGRFLCSACVISQEETERVPGKDWCFHCALEGTFHTVGPDP